MLLFSQGLHVAVAGIIWFMCRWQYYMRWNWASQSIRALWLALYGLWKDNTIIWGGAGPHILWGHCGLHCLGGIVASSVQRGTVAGTLPVRQLGGNRKFCSDFCCLKDTYNLKKKLLKCNSNMSEFSISGDHGMLKWKGPSAELSTIPFCFSSIGEGLRTQTLPTDQNFWYITMTCLKF